MIGYLKGVIKEQVGRELTLLVGGVGYTVNCTSNALKGYSLGDEVELTIYTEVKEDLLRLHGFCNRLEKQVFLLLLKVKGVGVKTAADLVSQMDCIELLRAIYAEDSKALSTVKGLGIKTAARIVLELKDRVSDFVEEHRYAHNLANNNTPKGLTVNSTFDSSDLKNSGFLNSDLADFTKSPKSKSLNDTREALLALGFSRQQVDLSLTKLGEIPEASEAISCQNVGELVRIALKFI
jgi:holliday junction DNA helicase RuvA